MILMATHSFSSKSYAFTTCAKDRARDEKLVIPVLPRELDTLQELQDVYMFYRGNEEHLPVGR